MRTKVAMSLATAGALVVACSSNDAVEGTESAASRMQAAPCGTALNEVDGVWAYSNGWAEATGDSCVGRLPEGSLAYQCVEFAQRYSQKMHGTQLIWTNVFVAADMCTNNAAGTTVHWAGSGYAPRHGDLAVWTDNAYGHVAVVKTARADGITIVEQNGGWGGTRDLAAPGFGGIDCFISGKGSGSGGGGAGGGVTTSSGPPGQCGLGTGDYCGGNGGGSDPGTLYHCNGNQLSVAKKCAMGCAWMPNGQNDRCRTTAACPQGAGLYCGGNGVDGDPGVLFQCSGGAIAPVKRCAKGCKAMPAGLNDECAP